MGGAVASAGLDPTGGNPGQSGAQSGVGLAAACRETADWLARQLGVPCHVIVRVPWVLGGDLSEGDLDRWHRETVRPAAGALAESYFTVPPHEPITLLLFSNERVYRESAWKLLREKDVPVYGGYRRHLRMSMVNLATGAGAVGHELTHALIDFDFPEAPEWLIEGLASLHEEYRISQDGSRLEGLINWRLPILQAGMRDGRARTIESLTGSDDFHGSREKLNYAQARYFCLYLQRLGALGRYYRELRAGIKDDPSGRKSLTAVLGGRSWAEIEADFRRWVMELKPS